MVNEKRPSEPEWPYLDSIISALSTAFFLSWSKKEHIVIPFINIDREDLALRSDTEFIFQSTNVDSSLLFFRDNLALFESLAAKGQLSLFLVDHNHISDNLLNLTSKGPVKVVGIIDHHEDKKLYMDTAQPRRVELVGSCTSLVADQYFKEALTTLGNQCPKSGEPESWTMQLSRLLLGPILIDTRDLKPEFGKVQPLDIEMTKLLIPYTGWSTLDGLFAKIDAERQNTDRLSFYDLLRSDYKEWTVLEKKRTGGQNVRVGISSISGLIQKYVDRDSIETMVAAIERWTQKTGVDLHLATFSGEQAGVGYQRQMIVRPILKTLAGLPQELEAADGMAKELQLERLALTDSLEDKGRVEVAYQQHNTL
ncbi:Exopolyphosphatase, partial [Lunasporangiospora selenospora]